MGFPIGAGDTFEISWSVNNGSGPPVYFEIHTHENGWTRYYRTTAAQLDISWVVPQTALPANESFMINWVNNLPVNVSVTYNIVDKAPLDIAPIAILPIAIGLAFGWFLWLRAAPDDERTAPGGGAPAPPDDRPPAAGPPGGEAPPPPMDDEAFQRAVMENEGAGRKGAGDGAKR
jgi:hypothetical protein